MDDRKKKILILYTGGTIGMRRSAAGFVPGRDLGARLTGAIPPAMTRELTITLREYPDPIDSADARPSDWLRIGRDLAAAYPDHDGFVVLHGTDSMAYTASALFNMLGGVAKPVVLTGSQIPLSEPGSDGPGNLAAALGFAAHGEPAAVTICFAGQLYRGDHSVKLDSMALAAFGSPNFPVLGRFDGAVHIEQALPRPVAGGEAFEFPDYSEGRVLSLRVVPGLPSALIDALVALKPLAIILDCYGQGTAPTGDPAVLAALLRADAVGILLVARSQVLKGGLALGTYAAGSALARAGVIGADMTFEALFARLHHLFASQGGKEAVRVALLAAAGR